MDRDFTQIEWDDTLAEDCRDLVRLAVREDLERQQDWTTLALAPPDRQGAANIVARKQGVVCGMRAISLVLDEMGADAAATSLANDGQIVSAGSRLGIVRGSVRDLLTCERTLLNLLGRLMGVATLTRQYVDAAQGGKARIYDTRKTTPGWRRLEKYAVRCGGGYNHRLGLYDAILIKDNHLAQLSEGTLAERPVTAIRIARQFLQEAVDEMLLEHSLIIEIEVDSLEQLKAVLPEQPDIVLLDNMSVDQLREAVALRNREAPEVELEASGGVTLTTLPAIAQTGVNRVSVGALTHAATWLDIALDWEAGDGG